MRKVLKILHTLAACGLIGGLGRYLILLMAHRPFLDNGWAWLKAALGLLMFKGGLTIVGAKADYAAVVSRKIADGEPWENALDAAIVHEWATLGVVLAVSVASVVLGI